MTGRPPASAGGEGPVSDTAAPSAAVLRASADELDAALPQTQCTRCGYPDCRQYAEAIARDQAEINQCPPGGAAGVARLAALTGRPVLPLSPAHGAEAPRLLAVIDEGWCIGCTLCLDACPVDAILGGPKRMHTVIDALCTGCELCVPACPVDCISLVDASGDLTGWAAWSAAQADQARERYRRHTARLARDAQERQAQLSARTSTVPAPAAATEHAPAADAAPADVAPGVRQDVIAAALARARARRSG